MQFTPSPLLRQFAVARVERAGERKKRHFNCLSAVGMAGRYFSFIFIQLAKKQAIVKQIITK